jgi:hypothetical protein
VCIARSLFAVWLCFALVGCSALGVSTPDRWIDALTAMPASRGDLSQLVYQDLPDDGVLAIHFDSSAPAHEFASGKSVYSAWRLAGASQPFSLKVDGDPADRKILKRFLPFADDLLPVPPMQLEVLLLDAQFHEITRLHDKGTLTVQFPTSGGRTTTLIRNHQVFDVAATTPPAEYLVLLTSDAARHSAARVTKGFALFDMTYRFENFSPFGVVRAYMYTPGIPGEHISLRLSAGHMAGKPKRNPLSGKGKIAFGLELLFGERTAYIAYPVNAYSSRKGQRVLLQFNYDQLRELRTGNNAGGLHWVTLGIADKAVESIREQSLLFPDAATASEAAAAFADRAGIAPSAPAPERQRLGVSAAQDQTSVEFAKPPGGSAWSRVGDKAMAGGVILASPCALCQMGGCTPDILAPCALLFSTGAAVGALTSAGKELISGGFFQANGKPIATASEQLPRIDAASRVLLDQTGLRDCLLDAARAHSPAVGLPMFQAHDQTWSAQLEPLPPAPGNPAKTHADLADQGYNALLESHLQKLVLLPESFQGRIQPDSPVSLRLEAGLRWLDLPSGDVVGRGDFGFTSDAHPLNEWTRNDNRVLKETLLLACRHLGGQMLLRAKAMWLDLHDLAPEKRAP